ncbi:DET1- and DDB1-associated protein 1 [Acyrthosiphon pisum]|uniref:DET1- and DDB1-associated protein 1 n=1 Tax=Acyrthosiphon pisum TaxID=7029 RepID=A0A8R2HB04_ACYPI|nr:DET1- and DDB1-associated protein 1 [Acyrthosiphon pisum]|eukprot:XP_016664235.1 PREDICTED: DET1- and DDB1-associated protein 1-like [Acyrthosiphon pisum]
MVAVFEDNISVPRFTILQFPEQALSIHTRFPVHILAKRHPNMSIAEFLDGMPSFDERNFSRFHSDNGRSKRVPVYITTDDQPCDQIIVTDKSNLLLRYLHNQWDKKHGGKKREMVETGEESGSSSRKRPRVDVPIL